MAKRANKNRGARVTELSGTPADAVRARLADLGIDGKDVRNAITQSRRSPSPARTPRKST